MIREKGPMKVKYDGMIKVPEELFCLYEKLIKHHNSRYILPCFSLYKGMASDYGTVDVYTIHDIGIYKEPIAAFKIVSSENTSYFVARWCVDFIYKVQGGS